MHFDLRNIHRRHHLIIDYVNTIFIIRHGKLTARGQASYILILFCLSLMMTRYSQSVDVYFIGNDVVI